MEKLLGKGSEGIVYLMTEDKYNVGLTPYVIKIRPRKHYRHEKIDNSLRKYRTRREGKIMVKAKSLGINVPKVYKVNEKEFWIAMEYINGKALTIKEFPNYLKESSKFIAVLHANNIIHGDIHPKNFILSKDKLYLIDFGLSFVSSRIEDKAIDLYELKKLLKENWSKFEEYYLKYSEKLNFDGTKVIEKLKEIEKRGRYKLQV